jgi:hypothetical protein
MAEYESRLKVNGLDVLMNKFVESFLAHTVVGAVHSLKGVDFLKQILLKIDGSDVSITVNGADIPLTPFPNELIANTIIGLVSSLKNVDTVKTLDIRVDVK